MFHPLILGLFIIFNLIWSNNLYIKYKIYYLFGKKKVLLYRLNNINKYIFSLITLITSGAYWAQQEISWGGWWSWDHVEILNIFYLIGLVFLIHNNNKFLINIIHIILGCYIVRYNLIESIHSFVLSEFNESWFIFIWIIYYLIIFNYIKFIISSYTTVNNNILLPIKIIIIPIFILYYLLLLSVNLIFIYLFIYLLIYISTNVLFIFFRAKKFNKYNNIFLLYNIFDNKNIFLLHIYIYYIIILLILYQYDFIIKINLITQNYINSCKYLYNFWYCNNTINHPYNINHIFLSIAPNYTVLKLNTLYIDFYNLINQINITTIYKNHHKYIWFGLFIFPTTFIIVNTISIPILFIKKKLIFYYY